jgi:hypothetical protein
METMKKGDDQKPGKDEKPGSRMQTEPKGGHKY